MSYFQGLQGRDHQMLSPIRHTPSSVPILLSCPAIYQCDVLMSVSQLNPSEVIIKHGSAGTGCTPARGGIHYHCQHITNRITPNTPQMWQISCCILPSVCCSVSTLHLGTTSDLRLAYLYLKLS